MLSEELQFKVKTATTDEIFFHLSQCDNNFIPSLSSRLNLTEYAIKIFNNAATFEAWQDQSLVGLVAIYVNDPNLEGYITSVSVLAEHARKGIAYSILEECIEQTRQLGFKTIKLEVSADNHSAICLYNKLGFKILENNGAIAQMILPHINGK